QRDSRSTSGAFNFGPSWECSWLSYVDYSDEYDEINSHPPDYVYDLYFGDIYMPSAGVNLYSVDVNGNGNSYYNFTKLSQYRTQIHTSQDQTATTTFNVTLANGATLSYAQDQYFSGGQHRAYLSSFTDPQGRTATFNYYLSNGIMCLSNVTDFKGNVYTM